MLGTASDDIGRCISVDDTGNIYLAVPSMGSLNGIANKGN